MSAQLKTTNMKDSVVSPTKAKQGEMLRHLHGKEWLVPFVRNPAGLEAYRSGMIIVSEKIHNYQHAFICCCPIDLLLYLFQTSVSMTGTLAKHSCVPTLIASMLHTHKQK